MPGAARCRQADYGEYGIATLIAGRVRIVVADEGEGIPAEVLERIRDPFFTTKHDTGGTGLGLSVSDKIVTSYGGELRFESEPGKGTVATVDLPGIEDGGQAGAE